MNPSLPSDSIDENLRKEFEQRWLNGKPGQIEDFLPPADSPQYLGTLEELVHIEIELTWKDRANQIKNAAGDQDQTVEQPPPIESYLIRFPTLDKTEILSRLLKQECLVRKQEGMPLSEESCQVRFPQLDLRKADILPYLEIHSSDSSDTPGATLSPEDPGDDTISLPLHFADYELLEEIGRGSMGIVYRAKQISNPRIVAVKILQNRLLDTSSAGAIDRFRQEIKAATKLRHENIVRVFDVNTTKGRHFFSMQYVRGKSLAKMTLRRPLDNQLAAKYLEQVARAIFYSHRNGILHRDLKPANILIDDDTNRPLVADFGLAKVLERGHSITAIGETLGTPSFMAPEQARDAMAATEQSDIYSLGATLYAVLSGKPPFFAARSSETIRQLIEEYPTSLRQLNTNVDTDLETICMKCMRKNPAHRYPTAEELANDLERYLTGNNIRARPRINLPKFFLAMRHNRRTLAAFIFSIALLICGSILISYRFFNSEKSKSQSIDRMEKAEDLISSAVTGIVDEQSLTTTPKSANENKLLQQFLHYYSSLVQVNQDNKSAFHASTAARLQMARIETSLGNLEAASQLLQTIIGQLEQGNASIKTNTGLSHRGRPPSSTLLLARAWFSLGIVNQRLGNSDRATKNFRHASKLLDYLLDVMPTQTDVQLLAADNDVKMGALALNQQQWIPSQKYFDDAIKAYQQLTEILQPPDAAIFGLARCYKYRGEWEQLRGNQRGYRQYLEASYRELEQIIDTPQYTPTIKTIRPLVKTCHELGKSYATEHDIKTALLWYAKAFHSSQQISPMNDPTGQYDALKTKLLIDWAVSLIAAGHEKEAIEKCQSALKILDTLSEIHPNNSKFSFQHAIALEQLSRVQMKQGNFDKARDNLTRAQQILSTLVRQKPGNSKLSTELEKILRLLQQLGN